MATQGFIVTLQLLDVGSVHVCVCVCVHVQVCMGG